MLFGCQFSLCLAKSSQSAQLATEVSLLPLVKITVYALFFNKNSQKYVHSFRSLSMFGACLCIAVMFMSHWKFALVAIVIGVVVYKYIEYRGYISKMIIKMIKY